MRTSIYTSDHGRQTMEAWYTHFVDQLGVATSSRMVETRFGATHILSAGPEDAPEVLGFHGAMGAAPTAMAQIAQLTARLRVHMVDSIGQPGRSAQTQPPLRGLAYGEWVSDVLDGLERDRMAMFGASMGGFIVLRAGAYCPQRVARAVLWSPAGVVQTPFFDGLRLMASALRISAFPSRAAAHKMFSSLFTDHDDDWFRFFGDSFAHVRMDKRFPALAQADELRHFEAPVMLIAHEHDRIVPAQALIARARAILPNLDRVDLQQGWRHVPPFAAGSRDALLERVADFLLQGVPSSSASTGTKLNEAELMQ